MKKSIYIQQLIVISFLILLAACVKIDYSPFVVPQTSNSQLKGVASLATDSSCDGVFLVIEANGVLVNGTAMGREIIVPSGHVELKYHYSTVTSSGVYTAREENTFKTTLLPDHYYRLCATPISDNTRVNIKVEDVSLSEFRRFLCATQRKTQESLKNINPQPAPACE